MIDNYIVELDCGKGVVYRLNCGKEAKNGFWKGEKNWLKVK